MKEMKIINNDEKEMDVGPKKLDLSQLRCLDNQLLT